jgi:hypothetical protein
MLSNKMHVLLSYIKLDEASRVDESRKAMQDEATSKIMMIL